MTGRRFPPPWHVEEITESWQVFANAARALTLAVLAL
jgi:hypothetical protein